MGKSLMMQRTGIAACREAVRDLMFLAKLAGTDAERSSQWSCEQTVPSWHQVKGAHTRHRK